MGNQLGPDHSDCAAANDWSASARSEGVAQDCLSRASFSQERRSTSHSNAFNLETWRASTESFQQQHHRETLPRLPFRPLLIKRIATQRRASGTVEKVALPTWLPKAFFQPQLQQMIGAL